MLTKIHSFSKTPLKIQHNPVKKCHHNQFLCFKNKVVCKIKRQIVRRSANNTQRDDIRQKDSWNRKSLTVKTILIYMISPKKKEWETLSLLNPSFQRKPSICTASATNPKKRRRFRTQPTPKSLKNEHSKKLMSPLYLESSLKSPVQPSYFCL